VIKAAAVADYRPSHVAAEKIKKTEGNDVIPLERTTDILATLGAAKGDAILCGFSMETEHMLENSRAKLTKKNLDMIAANNLREDGAGFATDTNVLTLITKDREIKLDKMTKEQASVKLLDELMEIYRGYCNGKKRRDM
jgi:phosphopantothenoylcysteine decarboxylase/phosphopantothenate--cysteine ligase